MTDVNRALAEGFVRMLNEHDPDQVDRFVAPDYVNHNPSVADGREAKRAFWVDFLGAFPDVVVTMDDLVVEGDRVAGRFTYRGTHKGTFFGIPATGRRIEMRSIDIWRVEDGLFVEHWDELNILDMIRQFGPLALVKAGVTYPLHRLRQNGQNGQNRQAPRFESVTWRAGNALVGALARLGVGPIHLLTTTGRRTGGSHTIPVVPVDHDGRRWLVAPYGPVAWVHNARATDRVSLRYGPETVPYIAREADAAQAGPVLKEYATVATKTRPVFDAPPDAPAEVFAAEAHRHPVFELVPQPDAGMEDDPRG